MNAATVVPLNVTQKSAYGSSAKRAAPSPVCVQFGAFQLDEANARLSRDGTALTLAPKPFGLLCALARRPGSLLTKNELLDDVWGHQFVSESVLKTAISDLRTVLHDDARQPRFIETVSRRGYRFVAPTRTASGDRAAVRIVPELDTSLCTISGALRQPAFATLEEVNYAHELRLRLRALFLRGPATQTLPRLSAATGMPA